MEPISLEKFVWELEKYSGFKALFTRGEESPRSLSGKSTFDLEILAYPTSWDNYANTISRFGGDAAVHTWKIDDSECKVISDLLSYMLRWKSELLSPSSTLGPRSDALQLLKWKCLFKLAQIPKGKFFILYVIKLLSPFSILRSWRPPCHNHNWDTMAYLLPVQVLDLSIWDGALPPIWNL